MDLRLILESTGFIGFADRVRSRWLSATFFAAFLAGAFFAAFFIAIVYALSGLLSWIA
jgi:hypothetical protein